MGRRHHARQQHKAQVAATHPHPPAIQPLDLSAGSTQPELVGHAPAGYVHDSVWCEGRATALNLAQFGSKKNIQEGGKYYLPPGSKDCDEPLPLTGSHATPMPATPLNFEQRSRTAAAVGGIQMPGTATRTQMTPLQVAGLQEAVIVNKAQSQGRLAWTDAKSGTLQIGAVGSYQGEIVHTGDENSSAAPIHHLPDQWSQQDITSLVQSQDKYNLNNQIGLANETHEGWSGKDMTVKGISQHAARVQSGLLRKPTETEMGDDGTPSLNDQAKMEALSLIPLVGTVAYGIETVSELATNNPHAKEAVINYAASGIGDAVGLAPMGKIIGKVPVVPVVKTAVKVLNRVATNTSRNMGKMIPKVRVANTVEEVSEMVAKTTPTPQVGVRVGGVIENAAKGIIDRIPVTGVKKASAAAVRKVKPVTDAWAKLGDTKLKKFARDELVSSAATAGVLAATGAYDFTPEPNLDPNGEEISSAKIKDVSSAFRFGTQDVVGGAEGLTGYVDYTGTAGDAAGHRDFSDLWALEDAAAEEEANAASRDGYGNEQGNIRPAEGEDVSRKHPKGNAQHSLNGEAQHRQQLADRVAQPKDHTNLYLMGALLAGGLLIAMNA